MKAVLLDAFSVYMEDFLNFQYFDYFLCHLINFPQNVCIGWKKKFNGHIGNIRTVLKNEPIIKPTSLKNMLLLNKK